MRPPKTWRRMLVAGKTPEQALSAILRELATVDGDLSLAQVEHALRAAYAIGYEEGSR